MELDWRYDYKVPSSKNFTTKCAKLRVGNILDKYHSLIELDSRECNLLVQSMPSSDRVLDQMMFPLSSLQQLIIEGFPSLMSFPLDSLPKTLKVLIISKCKNLEFLPHEYSRNYTLIKELKINYSCNSIPSFTLGALPIDKSLFF